MSTNALLVICVLALLTGCATQGQGKDEPGNTPVDEGELPEEEGGEPAAAEKEPLLDRTQQTVYNVVNSSAKWFDGFFGATDADREEDVSRGRLNLGAFWDQRDGVRERVRLKARAPLPAAKRRFSLILGRGDVDDIVDGSESSEIDSLPDRFNDIEDDDWLLGLGYSRRGGIARGWDFGVGVRLATPLEPYTRATYRWNRNFGDAWLWRVQPRVFWQSQRGTGASLTNVVDYAYSANWMFRSLTILQGEDEVEGLGWSQQLVAYQALSSKDALSYTVYANGETRNEVPLLDYGVELRYRKRIAREWLFIILSTRLNWPRELTIEERDINFGIGVEFEMQFGDWPSRKESGAKPRPTP
jgi:hypothetical protein